MTAPRLDELLGRIADGDPVDWQQAEAELSDPSDSAVLAAAKVIAQVTDTHRSSVMLDAEPPDGGGSASDRGSAAPEPAADGRRWGKYRLLDQIGEGSFGTVHRAADDRLHRDLAIKLLRPGTPGRDGLGERLLREATDLASIRHANVVSVYAVEEQDDQVGLCMEFIDGSTLDARVRFDGPLNADEALVVGRAVAQGLAAVHHAGLLHCDVKAKNVMRERAGRIVLMDLGASLDPLQAAQVAGGRVVGTPLYMAPELFEGHPASVQSDIYSLGVLLYFLVTGRHPVEAASIDGIRQAHAAGRRVPLAERRVGLPEDFVRCVERALSPSPDDRFRSAGDMLAALGSGQPVVHDRSTPRLVVIAAGILVALAVIAVLGAIATRYYNFTLGRSDFADEGLSDWLYFGTLSVVAPSVVYALGTAIGSVVVVLWRLAAASWRVAGRVDAWLRAIAYRMGLDTVPVAAGFALVAAVMTLTVTWWLSLPFLEPVLGIFPADVSTAPASSLAFFDVSNSQIHIDYRQRFAWGSFLCAAVWVPVIRLAQRRGQSINRLVAAGGIAVFVLSLAMLEFPYRLFVHGDADQVEWRDQRCYVLGERAGNVLLFCPEAPPPRNVTVSAASTDLRRLGSRGELFERVRLAK
jgi:hypothetical protein